MRCPTLKVSADAVTAEQRTQVFRLLFAQPFDKDAPLAVRRLLRRWVEGAGRIPIRDPSVGSFMPPSCGRFGLVVYPALISRMACQGTGRGELRARRHLGRRVAAANTEPWTARSALLSASLGMRGSCGGGGSAGLDAP